MFKSKMYNTVAKEHFEKYIYHSVPNNPSFYLFVVYIKILFKEYSVVTVSF